MAADPRLSTLADSILTAVNTVFAAAGVTLPARQYVHTGAVAWDCEQVTVSLGRLFTGLPQGETPGAETTICGEPRALDFSIWIIRCVPKVGAPDARSWPSPTDLTAAAHVTMNDTITLFYGLRNAYSANTFLVPCEAASFGPIQMVGPDGGFGGIVMSLGVQLQ